MHFIFQRSTKNYDFYVEANGGINKLYLPKVANAPHDIWLVPRTEAPTGAFRLEA